MAGGNRTKSEGRNGSSMEVGEEEYNFVAALQVVQSGGVPMVLKAVCELGVFGILAEAGPGAQLSAKHIADQLQNNRNPDAAASMLDRMLCLLTTHSIISCSLHPTSHGAASERRYGLTPVSSYFYPNQHGLSLGPFLALVEDDIVRAPWSKLKDAVLEGGIPFNMTYGVAGFDYAGKDPRFNDVFNKAMVNYTTPILQKFLQKYTALEDIKQLVDVGGSVGHTLHAVISRYPSIKGINFDLPHVIANAKPHPSIEHVPGNMFESVPKGDAILMKGILHDWSDDHCKKLLKNCYDALPENGKVILLEMILSEEPGTSVIEKEISQFNIYLMNIGGQERSEKEILALATQAGFKSVRISCRVYHFCVVEILK